MKTNTKKYLAPTDGSFDLKKFNTTYDGHLDKETGKEELLKVKESLHVLQEVLYAANSHSILILLQAMDAAGKDSAIEHVMSGINPQGCQVYSFKTPTSEEYEHDFLWRHYKALPERGRIGIHNRSHYENEAGCRWACASDSQLSQPVLCALGPERSPGQPALSTCLSGLAWPRLHLLYAAANTLPPAPFPAHPPPAWPPRRR